MTNDLLNSLAEIEPTVNLTSDNAIIAKTFDEIVSSVMNLAQFEILQGRTPRHLIKKRPGKGGKTFSYVPHGYVTAVLNRAFGFDWDWELLPVFPDGKTFEFLKGDKEFKRNDSMIVHGKLTIRVREPGNLSHVIATIIKTSTGEKEVIRGMTWGSLIKSAESDAFKKAASKLGVALDLYWQDADEDYIPPAREKQEVVDRVRKLSETMSVPRIARELRISRDRVMEMLDE